jgi:hypothetical protein
LEEKTNEILTAIVHGMKRDETSNHVRLAATNALLNSLEFTRANFEKEVSLHTFFHELFHPRITGIIFKIWTANRMVQPFNFWNFKRSLNSSGIWKVTAESMLHEYYDTVTIQIPEPFNFGTFLLLIKWSSF